MHAACRYDHLKSVHFLSKFEALKSLVNFPLKRSDVDPNATISGRKIMYGPHGTYISGGKSIHGLYGPCISQRKSIHGRQGPYISGQGSINRSTLSV